MTDEIDLGTRSDGSKKWTGWIGVHEGRGANAGTSVSEMSIGVPVRGKEMDIPTMVPGLDPDEFDSVLRLEDPKNLPASAVKKAVGHAEKMLDAGRSPFLEYGEKSPYLLDQSEDSGKRQFTENEIAAVDMADTFGSLGLSPDLLNDKPGFATRPKTREEKRQLERQQAEPVFSAIDAAKKAEYEMLSGLAVDSAPLARVGTVAEKQESPVAHQGAPVPEPSAAIAPSLESPAASVPEADVAPVPEPSAAIAPSLESPAASVPEADVAPVPEPSASTPASPLNLSGVSPVVRMEDRTQLSVWDRPASDIYREPVQKTTQQRIAEIREERRQRQQAGTEAVQKSAAAAREQRELGAGKSAQRIAEIREEKAASQQAGMEDVDERVSRVRAEHDAGASRSAQRIAEIHAERDAAQAESPAEQTEPDESGGPAVRGEQVFADLNQESRRSESRDAAIERRRQRQAAITNRARVRQGLPTLPPPSSEAEQAEPVNPFKDAHEAFVGSTIPQFQDLPISDTRRMGEMPEVAEPGWNIDIEKRPAAAASPVSTQVPGGEPVAAASSSQPTADSVAGTSAVFGSQDSSETAKLIREMSDRLKAIEEDVKTIKSWNGVGVYG